MSSSSGYDDVVLPEEIANRFLHHVPSTQDVVDAHEDIRLATALFATVVHRVVPNGRPKSLAFTAIEEAMHWANSGIACDPSNKAPDLEELHRRKMAGEPLRDEHR